MAARLAAEDAGPLPEDDPSASPFQLNANADLVSADKRFLVCQRRGVMTDGKQIVCNLDGLIAHIEALT